MLYTLKSRKIQMSEKISIEVPTKDSLLLTPLKYASSIDKLGTLSTYKLILSSRKLFPLLFV